MQRRQFLCHASWTLAGFIPAAAWAAPTKRIVSIGGALTEIIFALGQEAYLVGIDTTSIYPEEATKKIAHVGYARSLTTEGILSLSPTHVVVTEDAGPPRVLAQLRATSIGLYQLSAHHSFEGVLQRVQRMGQILGTLSSADLLQQKLMQKWQQTMHKVEKKKHYAPRVGFILSPTTQHILMGGQDTAADAMIRYAGGTNCFQNFTGFTPISAESLVQSAPDVLLFTQQGWHVAGGEKGVLQLPGVAHTPAGKNKRWVIMDALYLLGFGPRTPDAVADLHHAIFTI